MQQIGLLGTVASSRAGCSVCARTLSFQEKYVTHGNGNFSKLLIAGIVHIIAVKISETWLNQMLQVFNNVGAVFLDHHTKLRGKDDNSVYPAVPVVATHQ